MKPRTLVILVAVVAALLIVNVVQKTSHERTTSRSDTADVLDMSFDDAGINRVTIARGDDDSTRVVLERLPDRWVVRSAWSHPADERKVQELLDALDGLRGEFRSDSRNVLADYGLGPDADPVTVSLFGEDWQELASLELGDRPEGGSGVFVRDPAADSAFLCRTNVLGKLGMWQGPAQPENRHFLDLAVHSCERQEIDAIRLHVADRPSLSMEKVFAEPDSTGAVDRSTWEWVLTDPERMPLAKSKVDAILGGLTSIQAVDVADPKAQWEDYGLWKADRRVEIAMADGSEFEIRVGAERGDGDGSQPGYYAMTSRDRTIWVIRDFKVNQIFKELEDLLPEE